MPPVGPFLGSSSRTSALQDALSAIGQDQASLLSDLAKLIALDTSFPPGSTYGAFADLVQHFLAPIGYSFRKICVPPTLWADASGAAHGERVNLIAAARDACRPTCNLYFHVDTVPAGDGWTRLPFQLTREGNRLFGRGTMDMKGSIAAVLLALRTMQAYQIAPAYSPVLLFCTDEEGGRYPGIRYLAERKLLDGHLLSFNGSAAPRIWAGCFGSFDLLVRIEGRSAHSGDPAKGIHAIESALPLLSALADLKSRVETRCSALPPPPHNGDSLLTARLSIAAVHGGQKGSMLPARFELLLNRRYAPEESFDAALAELTETIAKATHDNGTAVQTELLGHLAPVHDPTGMHWPRWQAVLSRGFGFAPESFRAWGSSTSSDMGWVQQAGFREILLGGLSRPESNVHAADELTTLDDMRALACSVLAYLAADFAPELVPEISTGSAT